MSVSSAKRLLAEAAREEERLRRHLLVAAALSDVLAHPPIVVGGTAEEFWTRDEYHETDLDICVRLTRKDREVLSSIGFKRDGRYWIHERVNVAVEIPEASIEGDEDRVVVESLGTGAATIIGVDDLYLDRLRQATVREEADDVHFQSAVAVVASNYDRLDWNYINAQIASTTEADEVLGRAMRKVNNRVRARVRRRLR